MFVPSWLVPILAWAPTAQMQASKEVSVPVFFKLFLPLALVLVLLTLVSIVIVGVIDVFKKRVAMEEVEGSNAPPLGAGEMTRFESQSRVAPGFGKIAAVIFIAGLMTFMAGGMYSMGRGTGTTEQLKKEGRERQRAADKQKAAFEASGGSEAAIGEDAPSRPRGAEFGTGLDGKDAMEAMKEE